MPKKIKRRGKIRGSGHGHTRVWPALPTSKDALRRALQDLRIGQEALEIGLDAAERDRNEAQEDLEAAREGHRKMEDRARRAEAGVVAAVKADRAARNRFSWTTADGDRLELAEMSDGHLANAARMCMRRLGEAAKPKLLYGEQGQRPPRQYDLRLARSAYALLREMGARKLLDPPNIREVDRPPAHPNCRCATICAATRYDPSASISITNHPPFASMSMRQLRELERSFP